MTDADLLTAAIQAHAWPVVVGLVLVVLVSLGRQPVLRQQWERVPAEYRPLVPVALGLLSGVGEALTQGRPWLVSIVTGVLSGLPALLAAAPSQVVHRGPEIVLVPATDTPTPGQSTGKDS